MRPGGVSSPCRRAIFLHALGRNFRHYLPDALLPRAYPIRAMLDAGLTVALSSDAPVVENDSPLAGIQAALTRSDADGHLIAPDQAISLDEALDAYTHGGAIASGDDDVRGRLEVGLQADLTVVSGNIRTTPPDALSALSVLQTWVGGRQVYSRVLTRMPDAAIIRNLLHRDRYWSVYTLGDLDPRRRQYCQWHVRGSSVALLYREFDTPILFAAGASGIVEELPDVDACLLQIPDAFLTALSPRFELEWASPVFRMALDPTALVPAAPETPAEPLGPLAHSANCASCTPMATPLARPRTSSCPASSTTGRSSVSVRTAAWWRRAAPTCIRRWRAWPRSATSTHGARTAGSATRRS